MHDLKLLKPRPKLQAGPNAYHGAIDFEELAAFGLQAEDVIDFSVNSNPFGAVAEVAEALQSVAISRYPDKACIRLRQALSQQLDLPMDNILVGNGSAELLWLIAFAYIGKADKVLVLGPTFAEYRRNAQLMSAEVYEWRADAESDFALDEATIEQMLIELNPAVFHLCSPNNPTGSQISNQTLQRWSRMSPETLFVVDEAYAQFLPDYVSAMHAGLMNVLVLRSMTKDYALAGIRLGYVTGPVELISVLERVKVPWSVNEFAQAAGVAAIAAQSKYAAMWLDLQAEAIAFKAELKQLGYRPAESPMHYFLMEVGDGRRWRQHLLKHGLLVRLCDSYDLTSHVRLSTQLPDQNRRLLAMLQNLQ